MPARIIQLKFPAKCAECNADLAVGADARYYGRGRVYGVTCHTRDTGHGHAVCPRCGLPMPAWMARKGYQCNRCADLEEGPSRIG